VKGVSGRRGAAPTLVAAAAVVLSLTAGPAPVAASGPEDSLQATLARHPWGFVDPVQGTLQYGAEDFPLEQDGSGAGLVRYYEYSDYRLPSGPFGPNWFVNSQLRLYTEGDAVERLATGETLPFLYQPDDPHHLPSSFDGDDRIHVDLDRGHYESQDGEGHLERSSASRYSVITPDGTRRVYHAYYAPWRPNRAANAGQPDWITAPDGSETRYVYDDNGRLTEIVGDRGGRISLTWRDGRVAVATDQSGRTFGYSYNRKGLLSAVFQPGGGVTTFTYDDERRLSERLDPDGARTVYQYTDDGRVWRVSFSPRRDADLTEVARWDLNRSEHTVRFTTAGSRGIIYQLDGTNHQLVGVRPVMGLNTPASDLSLPQLEDFRTLGALGPSLLALLSLAAAAVLLVSFRRRHRWQQLAGSLSLMLLASGSAWLAWAVWTNRSL